MRCLRLRGWEGFRLFDAVADFLRRASDERPMLLILDDLHAADAPSLLLLQFVARELGSLRMVVIGTARDVDPVPGRLLTATLSGLSREPVTSRLSLSGLTEEDVAAYLEEFVSDLSPELASALYEQTEGHPFFLSETVRLLDVEGGAVRDAAIPQSIRDVIARRLDHLSGECNELLVLASVLGREFALTALMRVSELDEDELLGWLDEAMAARLVSEVPDTTDRLRFAHILIRDALYNGLSAARRVRLHRRVLAALETLYADDPSPHLAELAQHARRANEFRRAVDYAHLAADRAQTLLAYEEAARLYRVALDCLELAGGGDELRAELLLSIGEAEEMSDRRAAQDAFLEAATVARRLGETRILARAALGYGGRIPWARAGDDDRLVPLLEEGLSGLTGADTELRARLLARLAGALRDEHSRDRRDELSAKAVELGRRSLDPDVLAFTLDGRAAAISAPDTLETFVELTTELIELGERTGDPRWFMHGHASRFVARVMLGDLDGARSDLAAHNRLVDEQRQPGVEVFHVRAAQAMLALAEGRLDEAEDLLREAIEIGERAQPEMAFPVYAVQRYTFCDFRARLEEVEPAIRDLVATYPARRAFQCVLAHLYARLGRAGEARQFLGELSSDGFSALPFDQEWLYAMSLIAETCVLLQDGDTAADIYALLAPWAALNAADPHEGFRGSVARYLGQLAATSAQWDDAERHFEAALIANTNMGATAWVALTQLDFARMLLARDGPRDRERARELAAAALATCRELGLEGYAPEAELAAGHR
jgi:tetratricopeptide (TPR) repeat protein